MFLQQKKKKVHPPHDDKLEFNRKIHKGQTCKRIKSKILRKNLARLFQKTIQSTFLIVLGTTTLQFLVKEIYWQFPGKCQPEAPKNMGN